MNATKEEEIRMKEDKFKTPYGIGGWLLIPLYSLILSAYLQGRSFFADYLPSVFTIEFWCYFNCDYEVFNPMYGALVLGETVMALILAVWSVLLLYLIFKRASLARDWGFKYFITCAVYTCVDRIICSTCVEGFQMIPEGFEAVTIVTSMVSPVVWAAYFLKSKRVANTFCTHDFAECSCKRELSAEEESAATCALFRRFAARILDTIVVLLFAYLISKATTREPRVYWEYRLLGFVRYALVFDIVLYAMFRQTVGKKLFGIKVLRAVDGGELNRKQYMYRSGNALFFLCWPLFFLFSTWTFGHFWVVAIVSLVVTFGFQYCKVLNTGSSSYDRVYGTRVETIPMTARQLVAAILSLVGCFCMLVYVVIV